MKITESIRKILEAKQPKIKPNEGFDVHPNRTFIDDMWDHYHVRVKRIEGGYKVGPYIVDGTSVDPLAYELRKGNKHIGWYESGQMAIHDAIMEM